MKYILYILILVCLSCSNNKEEYEEYKCKLTIKSGSTFILSDHYNKEIEKLTFKNDESFDGKVMYHPSKDEYSFHIIGINRYFDYNKILFDDLTIIYSNEDLIWITSKSAECNFFCEKIESDINLGKYYKTKFTGKTKKYDFGVSFFEYSICINSEIFNSYSIIDYLIELYLIYYLINISIMKKILITLSIILGLSLFFACTQNDEVNDVISLNIPSANGNPKENVIERIKFTSLDSVKNYIIANKIVPDAINELSEIQTKSNPYTPEDPRYWENMTPEDSAYWIEFLKNVYGGMWGYTLDYVTRTVTGYTTCEKIKTEAVAQYPLGNGQYKSGQFSAVVYKLTYKVSPMYDSSKFFMEESPACGYTSDPVQGGGFWDLKKRIYPNGRYR